jgi:hypothetical protein
MLAKQEIMEPNNGIERFDSRKRLVFSTWFFHSFRERTTGIFDLINRYVDDGAKEKFRFAYRIQMNQIYLCEALANCSFHRDIFFEKNDLITTDHMMDILRNILHGVFSSELDRGPVPSDTLCCKNGVPEQKVHFYEGLFEHLFIEMCLLLKQSFLIVGKSLFLRIIPYRNNKVALEIGSTKDPTRKHTDTLLSLLLRGKQIKDLKTVFKKVLCQKLFVVSNQEELFFRIVL